MAHAWNHPIEMARSHFQAIDDMIGVCSTSASAIENWRFPRFSRQLENRSDASLEQQSIGLYKS